MTGELWISGVALLLSGASAVVAGLSYRLAFRNRRDAYRAEVAAFRTSIKRKASMTASESKWSIEGFDSSVYQLVDDLAPRIAKLPPELTRTGEGVVAACTDVRSKLRPWWVDGNGKAEIDEDPQVLAIVKQWAQTMNRHLDLLERFGDGDGDGGAARA